MKTLSFVKIVIDLQGRTHHLFHTINDNNGDKFECYLSFENIIKNMNNTDPWGSFNIRTYNDLGMPLNLYSYITDKKLIFETSKFIEICKILAPEYLV